MSQPTAAPPRPRQQVQCTPPARCPLQHPRHPHVPVRHCGVVRTCAARRPARRAWPARPPSQAAQTCRGTAPPYGQAAAWRRCPTRTPADGTCTHAETAGARWQSTWLTAAADLAADSACNIRSQPAARVATPRDGLATMTSRRRATERSSGPEVPWRLQRGADACVLKLSMHTSQGRARRRR